MAYFPFFAELEDRPVLMVGGGTVALRKIETLLGYGPRIYVCAAACLPEIEAMEGLILERGDFQERMLDGKCCVIAATDDRDCNRRIALACRSRGIPVNAVDDQEYCSFIFPAVIRRGRLSLGFSTGGASPTAAAWLKREFEQLLPEAFEEILDFLNGKRPAVKAAVPDEKMRSGCLSRLFYASLEKGCALSETEFQEILESFAQQEVGL